MTDTERKATRKIGIAIFAVVVLLAGITLVVVATSAIQIALFFMFIGAATGIVVLDMVRAKFQT